MQTVVLWPLSPNLLQAIAGKDIGSRLCSACHCSINVLCVLKTIVFRIYVGYLEHTFIVPLKRFDWRRSEARINVKSFNLASYCSMTYVMCHILCKAVHSHELSLGRNFRFVCLVIYEPTTISNCINVDQI